jgi:hypothetical protein
VDKQLGKQIVARAGQNGSPYRWLGSSCERLINSNGLIELLNAADALV